MRHTLRFTGAVLLLIAAGLSTQLPAQENSIPDTAKVEPAATQALDRMGAYLRTLKAFQVQAQVTSEVVMPDGQKVQLSQKTNILARTPDRLMADIQGDQGSKLYLFDGHTFTFFARDAGYYATAAIPGTLRQLVDILREKYDIEVPLVDLFLWGSPDNTPPTLTSATDIGPTEVDGVSCEQYAFRQEGLDWQVWIQAGDYPLPRKLVLTTLTDDARPQHTSILTWNLAPSYNEDSFTFTPPPDTHKIVFATNLESEKH
jgi:hypothetical protein